MFFLLVVQNLANLSNGSIDATVDDLEFVSVSKRHLFGCRFQSSINGVFGLCAAAACLLYTSDAADE